MYLAENDFTAAVGNLPLVSIDLCILSPEDKMLFVKRNCPPARDFYFTPGGRIRKNESKEDALTRISKDEIGIDLLADYKPTLMGVWDHFYPDSAFDENVSTHYVNLPHFVRLSEAHMRLLNIEAGAECQHHSYMWLDANEAGHREDIHSYSKVYAQQIQQFI
tara:strand:- start:1953 stop:2441 length:489 start_codon:yes stop_codon:yes gene_type:complete